MQGGEFANHPETIILHRNLVNYEVCATICLTKPSKTEQNPRKTLGLLLGARPLATTAPGVVSDAETL